MADQTSDQNSAHDYTTIMQQQQQQQGKGLPVPPGDRTGHCSQSCSSSTSSLPSLKDQLHAQAQQDFTALCHHAERQELERLDQSISSIENVVVGAVEIEQSLNDTAAAAITSRRSNRRRRGSNSQRALTTESHPFFDGTLEALIQQAERDDDDDDDDDDTNSNSTSDSNTLLASMDRLRVVDTSIRRTPRRGMRRPGRRISGRAARSA